MSRRWRAPSTPRCIGSGADGDRISISAQRTGILSYKKSKEYSDSFGSSGERQLHGMFLITSPPLRVKSALSVGMSIALPMKRTEPSAKPARKPVS